MPYTWKPKSCSPAFKLNYGTSESGAKILKSVTIRNISEDGLTDNTIRTAINNILSVFDSEDAFEYSIWEMEITGKYTVEED